MASALEPEAQSDRCLRHLTVDQRQSPCGEPWHRKWTAVSGKDPKEQRLKGRFTETRPVCPACSAPQRRESASAQARGPPRGERVCPTVRAPGLRWARRCRSEGHQ
uniref:Formation of mitochondrial complex V assembly factor 1-like protein n=1 Tax=Pipistrellus kuhlii TaxID=59472 RepID=A0A7J7WLA7_PIPKU|nr:formation of mitochondrial complex V assembly factor 1-like protein [Pipistrellus kuhlii]